MKNTIKEKKEDIRFEIENQNDFNTTLKVQEVPHSYWKPIIQKEINCAVQKGRTLMKENVSEKEKYTEMERKSAKKLKNNQNVKFINKQYISSLKLDGNVDVEKKDVSVSKISENNLNDKCVDDVSQGISFINKREFNPVKITKSHVNFHYHQHSSQNKSSQNLNQFTQIEKAKQIVTQ